MRIDTKKLLPIGAAIVLFFVMVLAYFPLTLEGQKLKQGDIRNFTGASHDIVEHREAYGEEPLWSESMFSGMPAYQISVRWSNGVMPYLDKLFHGFLPLPAGFVFLYLIGMYILLRCLRVDPWVAVVGAVAYGFSSYFLIILEAGHNSKANAVGYMPMVLGAFYVLMRGDKRIGAALFALFLTLLVYVNHVQVAYYLGIVLVLFGLAEAWRAVREKRVGDLLVRGGLAAVGVALALVCNFASLWSTYEYGKFTTRGPSELTISQPGGTEEGNRTSGLDKDYVTQWSYGKQESFSLIVPNAKGGASGSIIQSREDLDDLSDPAFRQQVLKKYQDGGYVNSYWGDQSFTSGPVYIGVVVVLLMLLLLARAETRARWWVLGSLLLIALLLKITSPVLAGGLVIAYLLAGLYLWRDTLAYALFSAFLLALLLSWGQYYMPLTDFFLDHVPGYDKFRAVTIILVIVELCAPVLGALYLDRLVREEKWDKEATRRFLIPAGALGLVLLVLAVAGPSLFNFFSDAEKDQLQATASQSYVDGLKAFRIGVFSADVWRSLGLLVVGAGAVWAFGRRMIGRPLFIGLLGLVVLIDLWGVDRRYVNDDTDEKGRYEHWEDAAQSKLPFQPEAADLSILSGEQNASTEADFTEAMARLRKEKQENNELDRRVTKEEEAVTRFGSLRRTTHFRVLTLQDPFNDARVSYFHNSIGGYHGAKLKRYQELITFRLVPEMQALIGRLRAARTQGALDSAFLATPTLNMLNMRYLIAQGEHPALRNPHADGPAWFVDDVRVVKNADEEITTLGTIDPRHTALVDQRYTGDLDPAKAHTDSTASVTLKSHKANDLIYAVKSSGGGVVVFSEIWYGPDWVAEIDGKPAPYVRADYVLRAMAVPAGDHEVRFHLVSRAFNSYSKLGSIGSWVMILLVLALLGMAQRKLPAEQ